MREYFSAPDDQVKKRWTVWQEESGSDNAEELYGLKFSSQSLAEAVCKALLDAYAQGFAAGHRAAQADPQAPREPEPF